jgi:ornithine cyclodeaminase/alanine dehydrogenase-like protein (mu-crystallin family)
MTLLLSNQDVEEILTMDWCLRILEDAFRELGRGKAINRPRSHTYMLNDSPNDFYLFKSVEGGVAALQTYAIRLSSDRVVERIVEGRSHREKIAAAPGGKFFALIFLFSTETCEPFCILPDSFRQRMRVGATYGLGIRHLARNEASKIGIFGAGGQAETQLIAACAVRSISRIRVFSPRRESRHRFAERMTAKLKIPVCATESPREVVEGADIIIAATSSNEPVFEGGWLEPGMHISFLQDREVDSLTLNRRADRVVIDARQRVTDWVMGQKAPRESQGRFDHESFGNLSELADVINGTAPGRERRDQITAFRAPGLGIQFASVGKMVYEEARKKGLGREIPTDWFLEDRHY